MDDLPAQEVRNHVGIRAAPASAGITAVNIVGLALLVAGVIVMIMGGLVCRIVGAICLIGGVGVVVHDVAAHAAQHGVSAIAS